MNTEEYVEKACQLADATPLDPVPDDIAGVRQALETELAKCRKPLKVVLMGASNSGKSTLFNALAGQAVSPVDVCETTAVIIELRYAAEPAGVIHFTDQPDLAGSIEEITSQLEQHRGDADFATACEKVELMMPLPQLRHLELVDTPGLGTLTERNQATTNDYVQQADVVIWTLNSEYISADDIEEEVYAVHDMGKRLICAATHIDDTGASPEEIRAAVDDVFAPNFDAGIYPIDAARACRGVLANDDAELEASGFEDFVTDLQSVYDAHAAEVQTDSILDATRHLILHDKDLHASELNRCQKLRQAFAHIADELDQRGLEIEQRFVRDFENWLEVRFLHDEQQELVTKIDDIKFTSSNEDSIRALWKQSFATENIQKYIVGYMNDLKPRINECWQNELQRMRQKVQLQYGDLLLGQSATGGITVDADSVAVSGFDSAASTIGAATAISAVLGGAASAYAAGLGTYAAHLSMAGALGSFMPPVLAAGVIVGIIKRFHDVATAKQTWNERVQATVSDVRRHIRSQLLTDYQEAIRRSNEAYAAAIENDFLKNTFGTESIADVDAKMAAIEQYRKKLEAFTDQSPSYSDVTKSLRQALMDMQRKFAQLKEHGIDLDAPDAFEKLDEMLHNIAADLIATDQTTYEDYMDQFERKYPLYDRNVKKDLATGELLRQQFEALKDSKDVDFSPALLPAIVLLERIIRHHYVQVKHRKKAKDCPWYNICLDIKNHADEWRNGFGNELLNLKDVRNKAVHRGNINFTTYDKCYRRIVSNEDSIIHYLYGVVCG